MLVFLFFQQDYYRARSPTREKDRDRKRDSHRHRYVLFYALLLCIHLIELCDSSLLMFHVSSWKKFILAYKVGQVLFGVVVEELYPISIG